MEYKNQTENRAFQEMLLAAVKRLQNRSGEEIAAKSGAVFHSSRNVLEVLSFYETIEIQLPEFRINSDMDEWHYLTLLQYPLRNDFAAVLLLPATFPEMHDFLFDFCIP